MKIVMVVLCLVFVLHLSATIINIPDDYPTIQEGIDVSVDSDTVLVQPGIYYENIDYIGKNIVIGSLFLTVQDTFYINETIIDGSQQGSVVAFVNGETTDAILIGFSITNGYAADGGGIHCFNYSNPSILYNKIYNNTATAVGGGINCFIANPIISNNIIENNSGQGIYCAGSISTIFHSMLIENNTISNNESGYGSGICLFFSNPFILNNSIINNSAEFNGGGIACHQNSDPCIINNYFINNSAQRSGGGLYCASSDPFVINNLFYDNYSLISGGGITCYQNSNSLIVNNTLSNNITEYDGGAFYCSYFSNPIVLNTILWGNIANSSGNEVFIFTDDSDPTFTYCDIEGGIDAFGLAGNVVYNGIYENNIDSDPLFIGIGDHPYSLQNISPCINAGTPDTMGLYLPEFDIAGNPRIYDNRIDIGAYETLNLNIDNPLIPNNTVQLYQNYPNPFNPSTTISFSLLDATEIAFIYIYNIKGQKIKTLNINPSAHKPINSIVWDGTDDISKTVSSGVYFYQLDINGITSLVKKMILLK